MLFRTKFVGTCIALAIVAMGCAGLLILSAQRSEVNQDRTRVAYESLSGYFQLSGAVFRTFKQARRDLLSGSGAFAFDIGKAEAEILDILAEIDVASQEEARLAPAGWTFTGRESFGTLEAKVSRAINEIRDASELILGGQVTEGRARAIEVLESQVDVEISALIEAAIDAEKAQLAVAEQQIGAFNRWVKLLAWLSVVVALAVSALVLMTLVRRFSHALRALEGGAQEYAADNLTHVIDLPGSDELSAVANRFSGMAQQIQTKQMALEEARAELEQRVKERTVELSEVNDALRERDRLRRQFFADIGHELRTPVAAIRGEAEVALRARVEPEAAQRRSLARIISVAEQLTESVADLFLIAREQAGVLDFRSQEIDLRDAAGSGIEQMEGIAAQKGAHLMRDAGETRLAIEGDAGRLAQLSRILISNALIHGGAGVEVTVKTGLCGEAAVLYVSDNGPGIPPADWPRIFDRYVRAGQSGLPGAGLGLAIAKSITKAHGGTIEAGSGPYGGTMITARFPLAVRAEGAA